MFDEIELIFMGLAFISFIITHKGWLAALSSTNWYIYVNLFFAIIIFLQYQSSKISTSNFVLKILDTNTFCSNLCVTIILLSLLFVFLLAFIKKTTKIPTTTILTPSIPVEGPVSGSIRPIETPSVLGDKVIVKKLTDPECSSEGLCYYRVENGNIQNVYPQSAKTQSNLAWTFVNGSNRAVNENRVKQEGKKYYQDSCQMESCLVALTQDSVDNHLGIKWIYT